MCDGALGRQRQVHLSDFKASLVQNSSFSKRLLEWGEGRSEGMDSVDSLNTLCLIKAEECMGELAALSAC